MDGRTTLVTLPLIMLLLMACSDAGSFEASPDTVAGLDVALDQGGDAMLPEPLDGEVLEPEVAEGCDAPSCTRPPDLCVGPALLRTYPQAGSCQAGCVYPEVLVDCPHGCEFGVCRETPADRLSWWYEESDLAPLHEALPLLAAHDMEVDLALHQGEVVPDELVALLEEAYEAGVPIALWPLLDMDDGYFPNVRNAEAFGAWWAEVLTMLEGKRHLSQTLVIDLEPHLSTLLEIQGMMAENPDVGALLTYLQDRYDPEVYEAGKATLVALCDEAHELGFLVHASTLFMVLDDPLDGDDDIQRAFDVPIEGMPFDQISFQVYRTAFDDFLGGLLPAGSLISPAITYDYGLAAVAQYGARAALDVGVIGEAGYEAKGAMVDDLAAGLGVGLSWGNLNVYALHILEREEGWEAWLDLTDVAPAVPEPDTTVTLVRSVVQSLDASVTLTTP